MKRSSLHGVLPLLIFAILAAALLSVTAGWAKGYSEMSARDDQAFTERTALGYVRTKINSGQNREKIYAEDFGEGKALVIVSNYGKTEYLTRLYCHNGKLYELFSPRGIEMQPEDGETIIDLDRLEADIKDGVLTVSFTWGEETKILICDLCHGGQKA